MTIENNGVPRMFTYDSRRLYLPARFQGVLSALASRSRCIQVTQWHESFSWRPHRAGRHRGKCPLVADSRESQDVTSSNEAATWGQVRHLDWRCGAIGSASTLAARSLRMDQIL